MKPIVVIMPIECRIPSSLLLASTKAVQTLPHPVNPIPQQYHLQPHTQTQTRDSIPQPPLFPGHGNPKPEIFTHSIPHPAKRCNFKIFTAWPCSVRRLRSTARAKKKKCHSAWGTMTHGVEIVAPSVEAAEQCRTLGAFWYRCSDSVQTTGPLGGDTGFLASRQPFSLASVWLSTIGRRSDICPRCVRISLLQNRLLAEQKPKPRRKLCL